MGTSRPTFLTPLKTGSHYHRPVLGRSPHRRRRGGTHPVTGEALAEDQTFTYRLLDQFPTLDPQLNQDVSGFHVIRDLFEGLLSQDGDGNLVPGVATSYAASDNNTTYTFTLRPEATWSNGDPVTAHDFVYAWRRAVDPATASPYAWFVELTQIVNAAAILAGEMETAELEVRAVDDHTLEVKLNQPLPYFPAMTTYATLFPAHQATVEAHGTKWTAPENIVSNGAYVLEEVRPQRVPHAGEEPDLLGRGRRHHRAGHGPRHQRRQPGADPLSRGRARPPGAGAVGPVSRARGGAPRPGRKRAAPMLLLLRPESHRERRPGAAGRARADRAEHGHRPGRDRRPAAQGRPVARLQLHPPQDRRLRDAGDRLRPADSGRARRRGQAADGRGGRGRTSRSG